MEHQGQILMVMIAYVVLLVMWGLYQGRKVKTDSDYSIAGRNLPGWVAALSERATGESSWGALLGLPGVAYATGLAAVALLLSYFSPSKLIFTLVSYVWAGIGGTFSVVILLTLFWKRFHGKAVIVTIMVGLLFTIIWSVTGMDTRITSRLLTFLVTGLTAILVTYAFPVKRVPESDQ